MITKEQMMNGLLTFADNEVMPYLPTSGKWIAGTFITLLSSDYSKMVNTLMDNELVKATGVVNQDGLIDIHRLLSALKKTADRYGNLEIDIPIVGVLKFSAEDVEKLKAYME